MTGRLQEWIDYGLNSVQAFPCVFYMSRRECGALVSRFPAKVFKLPIIIVGIRYFPVSSDGVGSCCVGSIAHPNCCEVRLNTMNSRVKESGYYSACLGRIIIIQSEGKVLILFCSASVLVFGIQGVRGDNRPSAMKDQRLQSEGPYHGWQ